jgi:hypothetical protein
MKPIRAGIFSDEFDFNLTTICLKDFLDRQYKQNCSNITGMWPSGAGAMLFFQVKIFNCQ